MLRNPDAIHRVPTLRCVVLSPRQGYMGLPDGEKITTYNCHIIGHELRCSDKQLVNSFLVNLKESV